MKPTLFTLAALLVAATSARAATSDELAFESAPVKIAPVKSAPVAKPLAFDTIPAKGGVIKITPILHASIQIEYRGKVILVDPIGAGIYTKKADWILITHSHPDHLNLAAIAKLLKPQDNAKRKAGGEVFAPASALSAIRTVKGVTANSLNSSTTFTSYQLPEGSRYNWFIRLQTVPMYNIKRGPDATHKFHPKGDGNGYILTLGGKRIYIAGDTEATPEMKALKNIDAAFIPMNLPYTMTPAEAAVGVRAFKPTIVYPYHFRYPFNVANTNPQQFAYALRDTKIKVRVLDWYHTAPVARFMAASKKN